MIKNTSKILFLVKNPNCAYSRYRCQNFIESLKNSNKYRGIIKNKFDESADIVVFNRQSLGLKNIDSYINIAKKEHKTIIFDIDDNLLSYHSIPYLSKTNRLSPFFWFIYITKIKHILRVCDATTSTNQYLANKLSKISQKPSFVIPNFLNTKQIEKSKNLQPPQTFTIGYFSGTNTHQEDLEIISEELAKFLHNHKDANLVLIKNVKIPKNLEKYSSQIIFKTTVDYLLLQSYYASVSVNLAPLVINDFTNCKSELKFFEAAIAETPTIASPTYAFKNSIKDGETGFLCYPGQWYDRLEDLYQHPEKRQKIAKSAKKYCLENYYGEKIRKTIEDVYGQIQKETQKSSH